MNVIDIVILCLFIPGIIKGINDGVIKQIAGIGSLFLGAYLAYKFSYLISKYVSEFLNTSEQITKIISFAIILIGVIVLMVIIGKLATKLADAITLGWLNKLLGAIIACVSTILILGLLAHLIIYINTSWFEIVPKEQIADSKLFQPISDCANFIFPYLKTFFKL